MMSRFPAYVWVYLMGNMPPSAFVFPEVMVWSCFCLKTLDGTVEQFEP